MCWKRETLNNKNYLIANGLKKKSPKNGLNFVDLYIKSLSVSEKILLLIFILCFNRLEVHHGNFIKIFS